MPSLTSAELAAHRAAQESRGPVKRVAPSRKEREIQAAILEFLRTVPGVVAWRNNVGAVKSGTRFVRFGFQGASDIVGWRSHRHIYDAKNGNTVTENCAVLLAIETKREGKHPTAEQAAFLKMVEQAGGIAIVAHSVDEVRRALGL